MSDFERLKNMYLRYANEVRNFPVEKKLSKRSDIETLRVCYWYEGLKQVLS